MGEAAGHFSYIEDPDGTLIEFVETHRLSPSLSPWAYKLNMDKRDPHKPIPNWITKPVKPKRVKNL